MSAPLSLRSQFPALYGPGMLPVLEELFTYEYESRPMVRDRIFNMRSTDRDIWQSSELLDLPAFGLIPEGTEYTYSRIQPGINRTYTPQKFGGGFAVSREMVEDGRFDLVGMMSRKLARAGRESQEIAAMNVLNNGFGSVLAQDGQPLFSAAHTIGGVTYSNIITGNPDLSESSLQAALAQFERAWVGNTGFINRITPRILVVAPENRRYAEELVGSELKPDTADNNMNSIRAVDGGLVVVSSPYLTDPDAWFLMGDPSETGLNIVVRQGLRTQSNANEVGFHTDSLFFKASYREDIGVSRAVGILGSQGS